MVLVFVESEDATGLNHDELEAQAAFDARGLLRQPLSPSSLEVHRRYIQRPLRRQHEPPQDSRTQITSVIDPSSGCAAESDWTTASSPTLGRSHACRLYDLVVSSAPELIGVGFELTTAVLVVRTAGRISR